MTTQQNKISSRLTFTTAPFLKSGFFLVAMLLGIASIATPALSEASGNPLASLFLVGIICGLFIPSIFRNFVPSFRFQTIMRPDFTYGAISEKAKEVWIRFEKVKKKTCILYIKAEVSEGTYVEHTFDVPVIRKEDIKEATLDLTTNTIYLPIDF